MPFVKGKSGNYGGRPKKGTTLTDLLVKYGEMKTGEGKERYRDRIIKTLYGLALKAEKNGDYAATSLAAIKYIFDRIDGKPIETLKTRLEGGVMPVLKITEKGLFDEIEAEERGGGAEASAGPEAMDGGAPPV
jgi:hypothetical protein